MKHVICPVDRRGTTLIEMLVAMALTLLIMATVVTVFDLLGTGVAQSRAALEVGDRLRLTRNRLQDDLSSLTCPTIPWARPAAGVGYFEYIEGPRTDVDPTLLDPSVLLPNRSALGDADDILSFTIRSRDRPFVAQLANGTVVQSHVAEVIWYTAEASNGMRTLYRRVLLVAPSAKNITIDDDISFPDEGNATTLVGNTLADLTKRENRNRRSNSPFPHAFGGSGFGSSTNVSITLGGGSGATAQAEVLDGTITSVQVIDGGSNYTSSPDISFSGGNGVAASAQISNGSITAIVVGPQILSGPRQGEDVMLSNVLAFDVRAYDPGAPLYEVVTGSASTIVSPGDAGLTPSPPAGASLVGYGAYVDLGYDYTPSGSPPVHPVFNRASRSVLAHPALRNTYDTWSFHFEHDGLDQDNDGTADEGTNGIDDDGVNGVDDVGERETSPPYPYPLRGIQVRIRVYEPDSRQIREVSVIQSFVPE